MTWTPHNDAHSRAVFKAFEDRLRPLMAEVAPDWLLHHLKIARHTDPMTFQEEVEIRLVCRPIGSTRVVDDGFDLHTGHKRLEGPHGN